MLNRAPTEYKLAELITEVTGQPSATNGTLNAKEIDGWWHPARPEGYFSLKSRWQKAWKVFTGKADIIIWPGGQ